MTDNSCEVKDISNLIDSVEKLSIKTSHSKVADFHSDCNLLLNFKHYDPLTSRNYSENQPKLCTKMEIIGTVIKTKKEQTLKCHDYNYKFGFGKENFSKLPIINKDLVESFAEGRLSEECSRKYVGCNLNRGLDSYIPFSPYELVSIKSAVEFLIDYEKNKGPILNKSEKKDSKFLHITRRHHLNSLAMSLFSDDKVELDLVYFDGLLFFHDGKVEFNGVSSKDHNMKQMCYHGFALESVLTSDEKPSFSGGFYVFNKCVVGGDKQFLVQAEVDAMLHPETETFAEIKCTVPLNPHSPYHARKLLKMWIQASLIPETEFVFGYRVRPKMNVLTDIKHYSREDIFEKLKSFNEAKPDRSNRFFNPSVATKWLDHIIETIDTIVLDHVGDETEPVAFKLTIDKYHTLAIDRASALPEGVISEDLKKWRGSSTLKD